MATYHDFDSHQFAFIVDNRPYYIKASSGIRNCFHVMKRGCYNEFGEAWCEYAFVTWREAVKLCRELNGEDSL